MKIPNELLYTRSHEWIQKLDETSARVGVTDYAQNQLGDLVFVNLPEVGDPVTPGESFADVESVKAVSDLYSPVGGTVSAINEELLDTPQRINEAPYDAWFIEVGEITEYGDLMDAAAYEAFCAEEEAKH